MSVPTGGIAGFDTGTKTGWAYGPIKEPGKRRLVVCGSFAAGWEGCTEIQACGSVGKWLDRKLDEWRPSAVAIEAPTLLPRDKVATVTRLHGIVGVFRVTCYRHGLKLAFREYHHATVKTHATGNQYADKEAMMAAARNLRWKFPTDDDDACDALWIRDLLEAELTRRHERPAGMVA